MLIIDGKKIAEEIIGELKKMPKPDKMLAAVLVGSAGSLQAAQSESFLRQKENIAKQLGIAFHLYKYDESITEEDLIKEIKKLGEDGQIGGIIVQLPLPAHYDRDRILTAINPKKDIDALTTESRKYIDPLSVAVVKDILKTYNFKLETKTVAVVGRGLLVGKPIAEWLNGRCGKLLLLNSKSNILEIKEADLVITGVGKAGLIKPEMLKSGAGIIDFGYSLVERGSQTNADRTQNNAEKIKKKLYGDFDYSKLINSLTHQLAFYTPTPGGTGPILVAEIFKNFYKLNS